MLSPVSFSSTNLSVNLTGALARNNNTDRLLEQPHALTNSVDSLDILKSIDGENLEKENLQEKISQAISESLIYKIFSAISRTNNKDLGNYNNNFNEKSKSKGEFTDNHSQSSQIDELSLQLDISTALQTNINRRQLANSFNFQTNTLSLNITNEEESTTQSDPLILDLDFNGFQFSAVSGNIEFDLNADGKNDSISNTLGKDAFLAIDLNGNGIIDNGTELFGDSRGAKDGFVDLARFDDNGDSIINAQDRVYDQLLLLRFTNNGKQSISSLQNSGVSSLSLNDSKINQDLDNGNTLVSQANFTTNSGKQGLIGDFLLATR